MSNRILWFLLIIWVLGFGYLLYLIFFVSYTGALEITSNVENYSVKMYAKKIAQTYNYECKTKVCKLSDISPFDYNITISSPTYKDYISELTIKAKEINIINLNLVKDTKLKFVETKIEEPVNKDLVNTKIEEIKIKKQSYFNTYLPSVGYLYFKENWSSLDLYKSFSWTEDRLGKFPKVSKDKIEIFQVFGNENLILISLGNDKYLYNLETFWLNEFKLVPKVKYIKLWEKQNDFLIITDVGVFTYTFWLDNPKYFYLFKDFVYSSWSYVWVIYKDEKDKFWNFSLKNDNKNVIIKYNSSDLQRKVILETDIDIDKIVNEGDEIYFYDDMWKQYKLENF